MKITIEAIKENILKQLKEHKSPMDFKDLMLSFSRYSREGNHFIDEVGKEEPLPLLGGGFTEYKYYLVKYNADGVEKVFKAVEELLKEGKCQIALISDLVSGHDTRTRNYWHKLAITLPGEQQFFPWKYD